MLRTPTRRWLAPVILAASASLVLAGCGGGDGDKKASDDPTKAASVAPAPDPATFDACKVEDGDAAKSVKITGDFGKTDAKLELDKSISAKGLERHVFEADDSAKKTTDGEAYDVVVTFYDATSGTALQSSDVKFVAGDPNMAPAQAAGITCVPIGSRVVTAFPASYIIGEQEGNGIKPSDTIIALTDVVGKMTSPKITKWTNPPAVTYKKGVPRFKVTQKSPNLLRAVLKVGKGPKVTAASTNSISYYGYSVNTGKMFQENFSSSPVDLPVTGAVTGFGSAMLGLPAGTTLIVSIPPALAYGEGQVSTTDPQQDLQGQTLVFVIRINSVKPFGG